MFCITWVPGDTWEVVARLSSVDPALSLASCWHAVNHRRTYHFCQLSLEAHTCIEVPTEFLKPFGKRAPTLRETDSSEPLSRLLHYYHLEQQDFHNDRGLKRPNAPLAGLVKRSWVIGSWFPHPTIPLPNTLYYR